MGEFPRKPDELTRAWMLRALGREATPGPFAHEVIGVGFGLVSTLARVTIGGSPPTVIVKWPSVEDGAAETAFLREIAPGVPGLPVAALRASEVGADAAVLVIEDVTPARQGDTILGATADDAGRIVDAIAVLHAAFWDRTGAGAASRYHHWTRKPDRDIERVRAAGPVTVERYGHLVPASVREIIADLPERIRQSMAALSDRPLTLIHDDLHLDNVLFRPDGSPVLLDWSDVRRGPAVVDFARVLVEALHPQTRRAHEAALAVRYVAALRRGGVRGYDAEDVVRDTARAHVLLLGAAVRWAGGPEDPRAGLPRVAAIVENVLGNLCSALDT